MALKVLPADVTGDADRLARLQREAHVLASLIHPNVAAIYGLEEGALVLELVDGETLAERLTHRALPLDEALSIARQIFHSGRAGPLNLYRQAADGTGTAQRLTESRAPQDSTGITPYGSRALFHELTPTMNRDLLTVALTDRRVTPLVQTRFEERNGVVSGDGRWLAYESDSSGQLEIYVRPFPDVGGGQWQVSQGGGVQPVWTRDGRELCYMAPDGGIMTVSVSARSGVWNAGAPVRLVEGRYVLPGQNPGRIYDVAPDGHRFLMVKEEANESAPPQIVVVQHWIDELRRLVPVN
jgi:serine/threonine-protein kinase